MRHKQDARAASARLPCSRSRSDEAWGCAARCCAMVVRTMGGDPEYLRLENGPCISTLQVPSASIGCDDRGCVGFSQRLSSSAQEKDPRPLPGASDQFASLQRFISNPGSGTQEPVPRLRERMQEGRAAAQEQRCLSLCISCARRKIVVQIKRKSWLLPGALKSTPALSRAR
jgi:hypothetical protein